jgi:hypothetical protein
MQPYAGAPPLPPPYIHIFSTHAAVPQQGGIFHDGSERAEALDTCIATWSTLSQNFSKEHAGLDPGKLQAAAPIFVGIFQAFVDALLQHAQVRGVDCRV